MAKDENYDEEDQSVSESFNIWWAISGVGYALAILFLVMFFMKGGSGDAKLQEQVKSLQAQLKLASSGKPQAGPAAANLKALIKGQPAWKIEQMFIPKQSRDMFFHLIGGEKKMGQLTNLVKLFGKDAETYYQNVVQPQCKNKAALEENRAFYKPMGYGVNDNLEFAPLMPHLKMQPGTKKNLNSFDKICVYFKHVTKPINKVNAALYTGEALAVGAVATMTAAEWAVKSVQESNYVPVWYSKATEGIWRWGWTSAAVLTVALLVVQLLRSYNMLCFKKSE